MTYSYGELILIGLFGMFLGFHLGLDDKTKILPVK